MERTLGGEPGSGQDATIIFALKGESGDEKLGLVRLHSQVLSTYSKYFNTCLSERWNASTSPTMEFVLEVQTDVQYYCECFSNMYSPFAKTFESVDHGLELLKVASQIGFEELMERISFYLSTMLWTKEEEIRVRKYAASADFPRIHVGDLVSRLGMDESKEDSQKQLGNWIRQCTCGALTASIDQGLPLPWLIQVLGNGLPSDSTGTVVAIVTEKAKDMLVAMDKECKGRRSPFTGKSLRRIDAVCNMLEALLQGQVAEELVQSMVHLEALPKCICDSQAHLWPLQSIMRKFAGLVLVMYQEVAVGRLLLHPPERLALLFNWHRVMRTFLQAGNFDAATTNLFLTLPLKQQAKFTKLPQKEVLKFFRLDSLITLGVAHGNR